MDIDAGTVGASAVKQPALAERPELPPLPIWVSVAAVGFVVAIAALALWATNRFQLGWV